jgi:phage-related tail protein
VAAFERDKEAAEEAAAAFAKYRQEIQYLSTGYLLEKVQGKEEVNTGRALGFNVAPGLKSIKSPNIPNISEMKQVLGITDALNENLINIAGSFSEMFQNLDDGFQGLVEGVLNGIQRIVNQLIAKAAILGIMSLLFPQKGLFTLGNIVKGIIPGFANGTNFAPGGLAMVGERGPELVNLPRGSQVIPNNQIGGQQLVAVVKGTDLHFLLQRTGRQLNNNT